LTNKRFLSILALELMEHTFHIAGYTTHAAPLGAQRCCC
jgi:hypothetical protein